MREYEADGTQRKQEMFREYCDLLKKSVHTLNERSVSIAYVLKSFIMYKVSISTASPKQSMVHL